MEIIDRDYLLKIDKEFEKIDNKTGKPIRKRALLKYDKVIKNICVNNLWFTKLLIINCLHLDFDFEECDMQLLSNELFCDKLTEYHKTVDIYFGIKEKIFVSIEMNNERFNDVKHRNLMFAQKQYTGLLKSGFKAESLKDKYFYQLNLNTNSGKDSLDEEEIMWYNVSKQEVYTDNIKIVLKDLDKYYKLYYNKDINIETCLLAAIQAKTFTELYDILSNVLTEKEVNKIVGGVIEMSFDEIFVHEWEPEIMAEEVRKQSIYNAKQDGIEETKIETAKIMLGKKFDIKDIMEITGLSLQTIKELQNKCQ